jgi:predicted ribosome quality control (RQC) complex YloA/Tae2 family protein
MIDGEVSEEDLMLAARITARFSKGKSDSEVIVRITDKEGNSREVGVAPLPVEEMPESWYL